MDSGLRVPHSSICQWNLDSGLQSLVGFWFPSVVFRIPKPSIPDSTLKIFWDSGFHVIFRAGSYFKRNRNLSYLLFPCGNVVSEPETNIEISPETKVEFNYNNLRLGYLQVIKQLD